MPDRRLAAILAADVVGYSALMAEDEAGTLEALRRLRRELFHPAVAGHRGKVVKNMGDGWLVEFASAVDAVNCAVQVQQGLAQDAAIRLRTGIHVGDITHEGEDIYGDGVNVAARLEAWADPGAIAISDAVYGSLDGTLTPGFDDSGPQNLKNIPRPVQVWVRGVHLQPGAPTVADPSPGARGRQVERALIVQPITSADTSADVIDLAAGLTGDLSQYLNGSRWLDVRIAERAPPDSFVLSGRLRTSGNRLRLEAALTGPAGEQIWADKIDGDLDDLFDWQDATASSVASSVFAVANDFETRRLDALPESALTAGDWMRWALLVSLSNPVTARSAVVACQRAIALDPEWVRPYNLLLFIEDLARSNGTSSAIVDLITDAERLYQKTMSLPPSTASTSRIATAYLRHRRQPDLNAFRAEITAILRGSPNDAGALVLGASVLGAEGAPELALDLGRRATRFMSKDRSGGGPLASMAFACIQLGRDNEALRHALAAFELNGNSPAILAPTAAALEIAGRHEEAQAMVQRLLAIAPTTSVALVARSMAATDGTARYLDALRLAGMPEGDT